MYHTKLSKVRLREAPYVVKPYAFDPKIAIGRGPAKRVVVYGFDPFSPEVQIRALMGSYGNIDKLENKTDANGSFLGVCSIWYADTSTRNESTKAHESARRAEKEGTGQKIGLKLVRVERDPEGTRARRYSERVKKIRTDEQQKADKDNLSKRAEPTRTLATPIAPIAPPPNAPKGPSGRGAGFRPAFIAPNFRAAPEFQAPEVRPPRIPAQHVLVEKAQVLPTLKRQPYIFLAHCYVPVLGTTIEHLKKRMKSYNWIDIRCDSTGYYIVFPDNRRGEVECERCFRDCHMQPLFTYTMNMECQEHGNPNYVRSPSPERVAAERRVDAEKQRLRELDEADFENEKRERAQNLDTSKAALELLGPKLVAMIMNDIKQKLATPSLFDCLEPERHREKRIKFGIADPSVPRPAPFAERPAPQYLGVQEWRPSVGTSLTWHRNGKPMSRYEKNKLRREAEQRVQRPENAFVDERRKKSMAARPRDTQPLHRRLQDFYESESDEETRTQLTRGSDDPDSRSVSEIPQTPLHLDDDLQVPKAKRRKTDKGWAADSEDEGLDTHTRKLLGHLIGKEPEDMAMRELEQVISTLPRTSKLRRRALTEVKLRKQAEEDDALFFGADKPERSDSVAVVDILMDDVEPVSTPELQEETAKPKKKKAVKAAKVKKTKKQLLEEQEAARKEAEAREKLEVALEEDDAPTPNPEEVVEEEGARAEVEWSVSADEPRKTVEDDPSLVLDVDGWQHVLKDSEDISMLNAVLEKEQAANLGDIKLWAWEQKEIKALNNGGKHGIVKDATRISGYYLENPTGCALTEGVKKIAESEKSKYLPHRIRVQKAREEREAQAKINPAAVAEAIKQAQAAKLTTTSNSRQTRVNNRRLANNIAVQKQALGDDAISIVFNQLKKRKKLVKFDRSAIHNWGLYADENIGGGEMIIEYVGELVRQQVANLREIRYQLQGIGSSYLFRIDEDLVVDATKKGGIARFINHSCSPSCTAKIIRVDGTKRIVIYALRDIAKSELKSRVHTQHKNMLTISSRRRAYLRLQIRARDRQHGSHPVLVRFRRLQRLLELKLVQRTISFPS